MFLINGAWQETLPANDRAIQFGDGCFTTARVVNGEVQHLSAHLRRLQQGCERLYLPVTDWQCIEQEMSGLAQAHLSGVLKVILTRGAGGRGYSAAGCHQPNRILSLSSMPAFYPDWRTQGVTLATSPVRLGRNPHLAGIKHLNRLEQVLIRAQLEQTDANEALVLDSDGWVTECCAANLFWRKGKTVFTPDIRQAGVNGIMRQHILAVLKASSWKIKEVQEPPAALNDAEEVLICNALLPVAPVREIDGQCYPSRQLYAFLAPLCE